MTKSDLLASVTPAMLAEVAQESRGGPQTETNIHVEDVPPNIRNTAYEMAGAFYGRGDRSSRFRKMAVGMDEYTFAIVYWPQFVNIAIECLTTCLTMAGIPQSEKDTIADELVEFNSKLDARAKSVVRTKKMFEMAN